VCVCLCVCVCVKSFIPNAAQHLYGGKSMLHLVAGALAQGHNSNTLHEWEESYLFQWASCFLILFQRPELLDLAVAPNRPRDVDVV
jgi:hypothetical protein